MECVSSLEAQTYGGKRLLVVCDTASTDGTESTLDTYCKGNRQVTLVKCMGVGRSEARNIGWRSCNTSLVMFADGDDVYDSRYLESAVKSLRESPGAGGACLGGLPLAKGKTILQGYYQAYGTKNSRNYNEIHEGNRTPDWAWVYKKECLEKVGGFDEHLSQGEDRDICSRVKKLGYAITYVPGVNWYRRKPSTVRSFLRKEYNAGKRRVFYNQKYHDYGSVIQGLSPILLLGLLVVVGSLLGTAVAGIILALGLAFYIFRFAVGIRNRGVRVLAFAFLALCARFANSLGTLLGTLVLVCIRLRILKVDPGKF